MSENTKPLYEIDVNAKPPLLNMLMLGFQHVAVTLAGYITMPLIICAALGISADNTAKLIAAAIFAGGLASLIQSFGVGNHIGVKLPVVLGCSAAAIGPIILVGSNTDLATVFGSVIASGIIVFLLSPFFGKMMKFFPPIVVGTITLLIGLVLCPIGVKMTIGFPGDENFGDPTNIVLGFITICVIILLNRFLKGFMQSLSILLGVVICTILAGFMGQVDASGVASASWFSMPTPFMFGVPKFAVGSILPFVIVCVVVMLEATGTFFAVGKACNVEIDDKVIVRGLRGEGLASIVGGIFNSFTYTAFIQNVSLVTLTKVVSRFVVVTASLMFIALGLIPKVGAIGTMIPGAVMGGAQIVMFAMVVVAGISILAEVDFSDNRNALIVAASVGLGLGTEAVPGIFARSPQIVQDILGNGGLILGCIVALILHAILFFSDIMAKKKVETTEDVSA